MHKLLAAVLISLPALAFALETDSAAQQPAQPSNKAPAKKLPLHLKDFKGKWAAKPAAIGTKCIKIGDEYLRKMKSQKIICHIFMPNSTMGWTHIAECSNDKNFWVRKYADDKIESKTIINYIWETREQCKGELDTYDGN